MRHAIALAVVPNLPLGVTRVGELSMWKGCAGPNRLVAFERNVDYHMSEDLKQAGGNENLESPIEVVATLAQPAHVYDLQSKTYLGQTNTLRFTLDPWHPSLFAVTREKLKSIELNEKEIFGKVRGD